MRLFIILAVVLLWIGRVFGQPSPEILWTHTYGGSGYESASSIVQTTDGGFAIEGYTTSFGTGGYDLYLVKTNSQGDTLWTRTYGGSGNERSTDNSFNAMRQTTDCGYVIAGCTNSFGAGGWDLYLVKTNGQGDTLWTRTYGGSGNEGGLLNATEASVQQTADGGYVIAGVTNSFSAGNYDMYVVKTDSVGATQWTRTYGGSSTDCAQAVQQTADGGYVIAGNTRSFGAGNSDIYVVKTNSAGVVQWTRTFGGSSDDGAFSVQQTADGGYAIAGGTFSFGAGNGDCYVVKTDGLGNPQWAHTYGGSSEDGILSIKQTTEGGYVMAGWTGDINSGDVFVVKTDAQGNTQWTRNFGGGNWEYAASIQETMDCGYVIAGYTASYGVDGNFYVVKTGPDMTCLVPRTPLVVITTAGNDARLNWNRVTQSIGGCPVTVTDYLVFYSPTSQGPFYYHGFTADTTYAHLGVVRNAVGMHYDVVATTVQQLLLERIGPGEEMKVVLGKIGNVK